MSYDNVAEDKEWTPTIHTHALAMKVLVVARTRIEGTWSAYCDAVPGYDHNAEYDAVLRNGDKLPEEVAQALFPRLEEIPYTC